MRHIFFIECSLGTSHLGFPLLLSLDLRLYCLPVNLNFLVKLGEPLIRLLFLVLLEEALPISDHSINVGLLGDCDVEGLVPFVHLNVHLDSPVVKASSHENGLSLVDLLAVE